MKDQEIKSSNHHSSLGDRCKRAVIGAGLALGAGTAVLIGTIFLCLAEDYMN